MHRCYGRSNYRESAIIYPKIQLAPVCQRFVFDECTDMFARLAGSFWHDHFYIAELTEIMRRKNDKTFAELLNRIRADVHTKQDVLTLTEHVITANADDHPANALCAFATNSRVNEYNERKLVELPEEYKNLKALDKETSVLKEYTTKPDPWYTGGLPEVLHLAVGARVKLKNKEFGCKRWSG